MIFNFKEGIYCGHCQTKKVMTQLQDQWNHVKLLAELLREPSVICYKVM